MGRHHRISAAPTEFGRSAIRLFCFGLALTAVNGASIAAEKLTLQLHREPQFEFAGYYTALWKGFYREAGLDIEIKPGVPPGATQIDPVREVIERRARFGTETTQLLVRAAQGSPLLLLATIFQQSGTAVYYRAESDFSSLGALLDARFGRLPASNILDQELRAVLRREGLDADRLKSVPLEPGQALAALAGRRVDAVAGSAWELPWQARERSVALKVLPLTGFREFYGDGLFTLQRFANAEPATVQRFREASLKGWEYALRHPEEIAARIVAELPRAVPVSDPAGFARYQSELAKKLARFPDVPLGRTEPDRWNGIQQSLIATGAMLRPVDLAAFLYDPGAVKGDFTQRLGLLALAAVAMFALFVAGGRLWRQRTRPGAVVAEAAGAVKPRSRISALLDQIRPVALARYGPARLCKGARHGLGRVQEFFRHLAAAMAGGWTRLRSTDLNHRLGTIEGSVRRQLPAGITCRLSLQTEPCLCRGGSAAVTGIILKLAAEAARDMPNGGELVIGTRQSTIDCAAAAEFPGSAPGDYVRVTVKDAGCGLSPERLNRVFYPETTARPAVAAAWRLMHRLGGFAAVESVEGVGTAVHLYFRRAAGVETTPPDRRGAEYLQAAE